MRKTTNLFSVMSIAMAMLLSAICLYSKEAKEVTPVPLRHVLSGAVNNPESPRSLIIEAYYDSDLLCVNASLNGAGTLVDVYIENQDTEEQYNYQIPGTGNSVLPISGTSGYWTITFILSNGDEYVGYFIL